MNENEPKEEREEGEYTAQVTSPLINGEVKLAVNEHSFTITGLFDVVEVPFADMNKLTLVDYVVTVNSDSSDYTFSKMGSWCQPFYDTLCNSYNKAVLRSLFVKEKAILTTSGNYKYSENNTIGEGMATIQVFERATVSLPPSLDAKRVPLCFVTDITKSEYELTLKLDTGESYSYSKLGYETSSFEEAVEKQIRAIREKTIATVTELDPSLTTAEASQIAKFIPEGVSASIGDLGAIAPSFVQALETRIANSRANETYNVFKELSDPNKIYVGSIKNETIVADEENTPDPYIVWMIAPSPNGKYAAVEFAEENTATFVYSTDGDFEAFAKQLNRALEAINFKREVIRLTEEELLKPENKDYYMAAKRTPALKFIRSKFVGRIIHSSLDSWKKKLLEMWA